MEKKEKLIIVILFSLSLSAILTNVLGQTTYTCEVNVGDEFIYTVTTVNTYWSGGVYELGDKMKIKITNITEETDYFFINYEDWDMISKSESFGAIADNSDYERVYKNPSYVFAYIYYFVLTPVRDYLVAFAETSSDHLSSGNNLTEFWGFYDEQISIFDSNGVMSKREVKSHGIVVLVLSRGGDGSSSGIPGYDLPILIGLTVIASVSIIYIVKKKRLK